MNYYLVQDIIIKSPIKLNYPEVKNVNFKNLDDNDFNDSNDSRLKDSDIDSTKSNDSRLKDSDIDSTKSPTSKYSSQFDIFKYSDKIKFATCYDEGCTPCNRLYLLMYAIFEKLNLKQPYIKDNKCIKKLENKNDDADENIKSTDYYKLSDYEYRINFYNNLPSDQFLNKMFKHNEILDKDIRDVLCLAIRGIDWDFNYNGYNTLKDRTKGTFIEDFINHDMYNYISYPSKNFWDYLPYIYLNSKQTYEDLINVTKFDDYYKILRIYSDLDIDVKFNKYEMIFDNRHFGIKKYKYDSLHKMLHNKLQNILLIHSEYIRNNVGSIDINKLEPEFLEFVKKYANVDIRKVLKNKLYNVDELTDELQWRFKIKLADDYNAVEDFDQFFETNELRSTLAKYLLTDKYYNYDINYKHYKYLYSCFQTLDIDDPNEVEKFKIELRHADLNDDIKNVITNLDKYEAIVVIADMLGIKFSDYRFDVEEMKNKIKNVIDGRNTPKEYYLIFDEDEFRLNEYYNEADDEYLKLKNMNDDIIFCENINNFNTLRALRGSNIKYIYCDCMFRSTSFNKGLIFTWLGNEYLSDKNMKNNQNAQTFRNDDFQVYYPGRTKDKSIKEMENLYSGDRKNKYLTNIVFESSKLMKTLEEEYPDEVYDFVPNISDNDLKMLNEIKTSHDYAVFIYNLIAKLKLQIPFNFNCLMYLVCDEVLDLVEYISGYRIFKFKDDEKI